MAAPSWTTSARVAELQPTTAATALACPPPTHTHTHTHRPAPRTDTTSPVLTLARGFFHNTEAVVYETDARRGMTRMMEQELPWAEKRKERQRQVVCWYNRMSLKGYRTAIENIEVLQQHVDALGLPVVL